jgi:hypothetical protein
VTSTANEPFPCYIRGSLLPNYDGYCPITQVYAYAQPDGSYLVGYPEAVAVPSNELIYKPGFLLVHLGSIEKDYTVETAAQALFNSLKSLFAGCNIPVDFDRIRTTVELSEYMKRYRNNYSHVILIGHGQRDGIAFLDKPHPIAGSELAGCLGSDTSNKSIQIVSLCCHSGCANLAKALSRAPDISEVVAPNDTFDIRWAVHFITGFLLYMYINGLEVDAAVREAARISGNAPMCIWRQGELVGECRVQRHTAI